MLKNIKLGTKLLVSFLFVSLLPLTLVGIISSDAARKALHQTAFEKLQAVKQTKKDQIEAYFKQIFNELETLGHSKDASFLMTKFEMYDNVNEVTETGEYNTRHHEYRTILQGNARNFTNLWKKSGYADIYMIGNPWGHVKYAAAGKSDLGAKFKV